MAVRPEQKKVSANGKKVHSVTLPKRETVMQKVVSFLKREEKQVVRYVLKIPKNRPIGNVLYTVESTIEPVTFTKRKDAQCFKELLAKSTLGIKSDIVRREITDEGYIPTYGDRK